MTQPLDPRTLEAVIHDKTRQSTNLRLVNCLVAPDPTSIKHAYVSLALVEQDSYSGCGPTRVHIQQFVDALNDVGNYANAEQFLEAVKKEHKHRLYPDLKSFVAAVQAGRHPEHTLWIDNDDTGANEPHPDDPHDTIELYDGGDPRDLIHEAMSLLGIHSENC
jgi:hypothetical protein